MQFFTVILSALALALAVLTTTATPIDARNTFSLNITAPREGDTWAINTTYLVKWDTSDIPPPRKHTPQTGTIYLCYWEKPGSKKQIACDFDDPLADGFLLRAGSKNVTVMQTRHVQYGPGNIYLGNIYFLLLSADSGGSTNRSGNFTFTEN